MDVGTGELADVLGIGERQVQKLEKSKVLVKSGHGTWPLAKSVQAFIAHKLQTELTRSARAPSQSRLADLRSEQIELRNAKEKGTLLAHARAEALAVVDTHVGELRTELLNLPARVTKDVALRRKIEGEIEGVYRAAYARLGKEIEADEAKEGRP